MTNTKKNKRWLSLLMAMMVILSFSLSTVWAAPAARTMRIRLSDGYGYANADIKITPSNSNGMKGKIKVLSDVEWYAPCHNYGLVGLDAGTEFEYTISSLKEGGKITLKYVNGTGDVRTDYVMNIHQGGYPNFKTLTGKIHINGSNTFAHIWKIDGFTKNGQKLGIYFRDT